MQTEKKIYQDENGRIVIENRHFCLMVGSDALCESLILKKNGRELLDKSERKPIFSLTEKRPYNNEIKLMWPNKRTTYPANRLRREGDRLVVGFETAPYEAVVGVKTGGGYVAFELEGFNCVRELDYEGLAMDVPPVARFRVLQLPVKCRENVGDWLNVVWDDRAAVAVPAVLWVPVCTEKNRKMRKRRSCACFPISVAAALSCWRFCC